MKNLAVGPADVRKVAQGIINKWPIPERIEFVDAIDKSSVGKIDKKKLRARYCA